MSDINSIQCRFCLIYDTDLSSSDKDCSSSPIIALVSVFKTLKSAKEEKEKEKEKRKIIKLESMMYHYIRESDGVFLVSHVRE